ncbi:MAG TPA: endolytic transglycosylase MltG [Patescibacteria group bacterium]
MKFKMRRFIFFFLLICFLSVGIAAAYIGLGSRPVSADSTPKTFVINEGDGISSIAARLERNHLIRNQYSFIFRAYLLGLRSRLQSGQYRLSASMDVDNIIVKLSKGGSKDYWLKIIDGSRIEEIAADLPASSPVNPVEFAHEAKNKEGTLYPDSYLIPEFYSSADIISSLQSNFNKKLAQAKSGVVDSNLTDDQALILASLLEREAKTVESKQMVAGILLNRIAAGMPLQIDASVQYARDSRLPAPKNYWQPLAASDIDKIISPYNTYKNPGLPPGPICSPGFNSLFAVYHPVKSDNFFYITGNDRQMHYAKTLAEHNQNIAKYLK